MSFDIREAEPGEKHRFFSCFIQPEDWHKLSTGSVEDRIAISGRSYRCKGNKYHLNVDKKGFEGEEYTISGDYLAYQDMSVPLGQPDFKGVQRDGDPCRKQDIQDAIFRS